METIYKGTLFELDVVIISENENERYKNNMQVKLYNKATKTVIELVNKNIEEDDDRNTYTYQLSLDNSKSMPIGMYDLDVYDDDSGFILCHIDNYVRCMVSAQSLK